MMDNKTATKIKEAIDPNSLFYPVVRFWNDYFVFYRVYWRAFIFILLLVSAYFVWPYLALIVGDAGGKLTIPTQTIAGNKSNLTGYPAGLPDEAITIILTSQKYVAPGDKANFNFYLKQTAPIPAENHQVTFKIIPLDMPAVIGETVLSQTTPGVWQATNIISLDLPNDYSKDMLQYQVRVETKPNCPKEDDPNAATTPECVQPPIALELKDLQTPVVRWPVYIIQVLVFAGALGFFGISQIGPAILSLLFPGRNEKK
jgi:hypothetical protein